MTVQIDGRRSIEVSATEKKEECKLLRTFWTQWGVLREVMFFEKGKFAVVGAIMDVHGMGPVMSLILTERNENHLVRLGEVRHHPLRGWCLTS